MTHNWLLFRRLLFIVFVLLSTTAFPAAYSDDNGNFSSSSSKDPYEILGVRRNASISDIKQAYKKLAKIWHPDKNKDPATRKYFPEISRAYRQLIDPDLRARYDRYGGDSARNHDDQSERNPFADFYFGSFGQSEYQFHNAANFFNKHDIGLRIYDNSLVNNSHYKPYLIFVYVDWCQSCMRAERLWERVVSILEPDGYGIATINSKMEGTLVDRLRVRKLPAVLALVDGRPIHYHGGAIDAFGLLKFAHLVVPKTYVSGLNDGNYRQFLQDAWRRNKVSAIACGPKDEPDLRVTLAAMRYRSYFSFGYLSISDNAAAARQFLAEYRITTVPPAIVITAQQQQQTFILFNERINAPISKLQSPPDEITAESISAAMESNKYLLLPRLSSQTYFDDLCPYIVDDDRRAHRFCVILLARTGGIEQDEMHINGFRETVRATTRTKDRFADGAVRFCYVYEERQPAFSESLAEASLEKKETASTTTIGDRRHVVILWRTSPTTAKVLWLRHLWTGSPETVNRSADLLLAKVDGVVRATDNKDARISSSVRQVTLKELVDEDAPPVYKRLVTKVTRSWQTFLHHVGKDEFLPAISVLGTLLLMVLIGYGLNYIVDSEKKEEEAKKRRRERGKPIEETKEYKTLMRELRAETYFGMVRLLKPGFRSIVVLVDAETKDMLVKQFGRAIWPWRKNKTLLFGFVMVEKNLNWFRRLLELALADPDLRLKQTINPRNVIGTVLSLNGFRQFFSMYHPKHAPSMVGYKAAAEQRRRARDPSRYFLGLAPNKDDSELDEDEEDNDNDLTAAAVDGDAEHDTDRDELLLDDGESRGEGPAGVGAGAKAKRSGTGNGDATSAKEFLKTKILKVDELLDGLPNWLERLFRGNARRYYIPEWPQIR